MNSGQASRCLQRFPPVLFFFFFLWCFVCALHAVRVRRVCVGVSRQ